MLAGYQVHRQEELTVRIHNLLQLFLPEVVVVQVETAGQIIRASRVVLAVAVQHMLAIIPVALEIHHSEAHHKEMPVEAV